MITKNHPSVPFILCALLAGPPARAQLGVAATAGSSQPVTSSLSSASATGAIQTCAFEARNQLLLDIDSRVKIAESRLGNLSSKARTLPTAAQQEFASALDAIKLQGKALKTSMESAQKATTKTWPEMRVALGFSYSDYVGAVARVEKSLAGAHEG
jgi:hypothetical protein